MHSRLKFDIGWGALLWSLAGPPVSPRELSAAEAFLALAFAGRTVVIALSVRTLFDAILSELGLPPASTVLASGVNIQNMAEIISAHQLKLDAVDIDAGTLAPPEGALLKAQAVSGAQLCLVTQLFGAANEFVDCAALRQSGVFVVEDAAQAFAGTFHHGCEDVDVSLFSFGPIKRRTALGGGIAAFRDASFASRVATRIAGYEKRSEASLRLRALKYLGLKGLSHPLAYGAVVALISCTGRNPDAVIGKVARGFSGPDLLKAIRHRLPDRMIALMAKQIAGAGSPSHRRAVCEEFLQMLPSGAAVGALAQKHAYWLLPILADAPDKLICALRAKGFDATRGATSLRALSPSQTPRAKTLMDRVVYLPHPFKLTESERRRMAEVIGSEIEAGRPGAR